VVGAGLSGVLAGILIPPKVPNVKLTIFEKNAGVVSLLSFSSQNPQLNLHDGCQD
jgi:protoporphyrinogen oxidase